MPQTAYYCLGRSLGHSFVKKAQTSLLPSREELAKYYGGVENLKHPDRDSWMRTRNDNVIHGLLLNRSNPALRSFLINRYKKKSGDERVAPLLTLISSLSDVPQRELLRSADVVPVDAPFMEEYIREFANRVPRPGRKEIDESVPLEEQYFSTKPSLFGEASTPFNVEDSSENNSPYFNFMSNTLHESSSPSIEATLHELGHAVGSPILHKIVDLLNRPNSIMEFMSSQGATSNALTAAMTDPSMKGRRLFPLKAYALTKAIAAIPSIVEEARASYLGRQAYKSYGKKQGPGYQLPPSRFWISPASQVTSAISDIGSNTAGSLAGAYNVLREQRKKRP